MSLLKVYSLPVDPDSTNDGTEQYRILVYKNSNDLEIKAAASYSQLSSRSRTHETSLRGSPIISSLIESDSGIQPCELTNLPKLANIERNREDQDNGSFIISFDNGTEVVFSKSELQTLLHPQSQSRDDSPGT